MDTLFHFQTWLTLLTLIVLELVLGVDNLVFISIASHRLPEHQQPSARRLGLALALIIRLLLLAALIWLVSLQKPLFTLLTKSFSVSDLIFIGGGLFLIYETLSELRTTRLTTRFPDLKIKTRHFATVVVQIIFFDVIFSLDSIFTSIALVRQYAIMAAAVIVSFLIVMVASTTLSNLVKRYPKVKILALSFLILVGGMLLLEGFGVHVPRSYLFAVMAFAIFNQLLFWYAKI